MYKEFRQVRTICILYIYSCIIYIIFLLAGFFVIDQVEVLIIEPLLDVLMSTSPENNISKVSELMLLTLFARQDSHRIGMYM